MEILIDNKKYTINENEYNKIQHKEYNNLRLYDNIGLHERIIGFIKKCKEVYSIDNPDFISCNTAYGGFIPINVSNNFNHICLIHTEEPHFSNINENIKKQNINNIDFHDDGININKIIYSEEVNNIIEKQLTHQSIILITKDNNFIVNSLQKFCLSGTDYYIYVSENLVEKFTNIFQYHIGAEMNGIKMLYFDNLINLCIMVKNAGPQFEQMLIDNLHIIDRWTILDTGSTDETIDIINRVLVGKKEGQLYQEPFINFRESRNRLLDLAAISCKYNIILDDTYLVKGKLREFLTEVRSDQYSNSFTLYIKSDDTIYGSNRIIRSDSGLRYIHTIHEVITDKNNINVVIPEECAFIFDKRFDYMEKRTMERKQLDLKLLYEEVEENPNDPRAYYYLAQTYNSLEDYENAYKYFLKRAEFTNSGFIQERVDALFEAARVANFKLNKPWSECEELYNRCFKVDDSRPESLYFIGTHYYFENNYKIAYEYFKKAFEKGFPLHCQYSLKPTLSYHFLPKLLTKICYEVDDYELGLKASEFFILNNKPTDDCYEEVVSWYKIFQKLTMYTGIKIPNVPDKPIFCFVADGGFQPWTGSNILTSGVGGSETFIIEIARYIKKQDKFDVYVFCNTPNQEDENFEGVNYKHLNKYYEFINTNYVKHCIISRFSEYIPLTIKGFSENVYFIIHDLTPSGIVIPIDKKIKNIFCLTDWHVQYFTNIFPQLKPISLPFHYGIDNRFQCDVMDKKINHKFIYSSFPNRGLLQLLQMWPKIYKKEPTSTLHIYSDVNNKWSNDVEPEKMSSIKKLLNEYSINENGLGIYYHGWVTKQELAEAWITSDIWFYPCTFMETFCLTALEAASSKTFVVTNDLAALQNTVGNRGAIIKGDPTTEEWQEEALNKLFYYMSDNNKVDKQNLIEMNYQWAKSLSWENQALKLLANYIYPNDIFEYKGMYNWTNDLPQGSKDIFLNIISYFNNNYYKVKFEKKINILEIGTYAGISLIELVKLIPNSFGTGIYLWTNYNENELLQVIDNLKVKNSFYKNIINAGLANRIKGIQINSTSALFEFIKDNVFFDFIYVDGSHLLLDCYSDLVLSWQILEKGGILAIDDYVYKKDDKNILNSPYNAVNHFLKLYKGQYNILSISYRVFLEKI